MVRIGREFAVIDVHTIVVVGGQRNQGEDIAGLDLEDHDGHVGVGLRVQRGVGQIVLDAGL